LGHLESASSMANLEDSCRSLHASLSRATAAAEAAVGGAIQPSEALKAAINERAAALRHEAQVCQQRSAAFLQPTEQAGGGSWWRSWRLAPQPANADVDTDAPRHRHVRFFASPEEEARVRRRLRLIAARQPLQRPQAAQHNTDTDVPHEILTPQRALDALWARSRWGNSANNTTAPASAATSSP
jgi:hypothetical protein